MTEPIAAIATAPGRGGIGVVRVSGRNLVPLMTAVLGREIAPRQAVYAAFKDRAGEAIDRGVALYFPAPHSYTGEAVLELQGHGGPVVMQLVLRRVLEAGQDLGVRLARPGEFTERAYLNDKLDLAQAEAVADLIDASTERAARAAGRTLQGDFSRTIEALFDELVSLRMLVEATLDFPDEEIDFLQRDDALGRLAQVRQALQRVQRSAARGALLREGITVVLLGEPNVGKSSLLNALAGAELAIVTPIAGTTRDRIRQTIQIDGVALTLIDTAGLRSTDDEVERIGVARSWEAAQNADVVLHLMDARAVSERADDAGTASEAVKAGEELSMQLRARLGAETPRLQVYNKADLVKGALRLPAGALAISALTGQGMDDLRSALLRLAGGDAEPENEFIARERHLLALKRSAVHLQGAADHAAQGAQALELFAEELRLAQESLGEITGAFSADDLLGEIFSRFCIGK
jgi:tRNA modification GTPase